MWPRKDLSQNLRDLTLDKSNVKFCIYLHGASHGTYKAMELTHVRDCDGTVWSLESEVLLRGKQITRSYVGQPLAAFCSA